MKSGACNRERRGYTKIDFAVPIFFVSRAKNQRGPRQLSVRGLLLPECRLEFAL